MSRDATESDIPDDPSEVEVDADTLTRIRERILQAEKEQLHLKVPYKIKPEIEDIIREEVD